MSVNEIIPAWSNASMVMYVLLGLQAVAGISRVQKINRNTRRRLPVWNICYTSIVIVWDIVASFRYVHLIGPGSVIGGADTFNYIYYFENCLNMSDAHAAELGEHFELGYVLVCRAIRLFTSNYHIFFLVCYGFIIFSFIYFVNEFITAKTSAIPFILLIFELWRGFNTFRTTFAIAFILIGLVKIRQHKEKAAAVFIITSCLVHTSSIVYALFLLFYDLYKKKKIRLWHAAVLFWLVYVGARYGQKLILGPVSAVVDLNKKAPITGYVSHSLKKSIFAFSMINLEHAMLFVVMILYEKRFNKGMLRKMAREQTGLRLLLMICFFDFLTIPINFVLGTWRGYEFFYVPRLVMWGEVIGIAKSRFVYGSRWVLSVIMLAVFGGWLVFRFYNMWEDSCLMPYVFELFVYR